MFPSDKITIAKKDSILVIKFSLIKIKGLFTKKRPTSVIINCEKGKESAYIVRHKKKTYTKIPIEIDDKHKVSLSYELARSVVSNYHIKQRIVDLNEKVLKINKKKTETVVNFYV